MLKEIVLPELSDNITAADVLKVLVAPGDRVAAEQPLFELETDKAVFELPSPEAGVVREVRAKVGDKVPVGAVLLLLEAEVGAEVTAPAPPARAAAPEAASVPPAPALSAVPPALPLQSAAPEPPETGRGGPAAPHVRKLARELGVDLARVAGTGPKGRVTEEDVRRASLGPQTPPAPPRVHAPPPAARGEVRREPMSTVRRITAETLSRAWAAVPQVTQHDRADVTDLEAFRAKHADAVERAGGKLTVTAVLIKVCAEALRRFPQFNASVDMEASEVVYRSEVSVGVAVDTERGLLVPVVRDADRKTLTEVAVDLARLSEKARARRILPAELEGGSFTISNLGGIGGTGFSPIVVPPQVAILGVSRSEVRPVWDEGAEEFLPALQLPLSLTYDHRLIDGADGARFLRWVCEALEEPLRAWL